MMANDFSRQLASGQIQKKLPYPVISAVVTIAALSLFICPVMAQTAETANPAKTTKAAPSKPAPSKPAPTTPAPTKPTPTKLAPTTPAPTKLAPTKPASTKPAVTKASQTQAVSGPDGAKPGQLSEETKHIIKARSMAGEGRYDDACAELKNVLQSNPKNVDAFYFLGYVLGRQGKYELSIGREKSALEIDPNNAAAYAVLGLSLGSLHQYSEAARALQQSIKLQPLAPNSYVNLAAICEKQGDNKRACNLYRRAIAINPQYAKAYLGLGEALGKLGDKMGNVDACRAAVKYAPKSAIAHAKLGMALSEAGNIGGSVSEGFTANALKVQESWNDFLGTFLAAWGLVFLGFSLFFAIVFAGSRFKPQDGEKVLRSFFLTFYKDQPGRFVVTDSRLVFVPEIFSQVFGATRVSIQRAQVESIQYLSTMGGGTVSILTKDQSVHQFRMPILVLDPLRSLLVGQALAAMGNEPEAEAAAPEASVEPSKESSAGSSTDSATGSSSGSSADPSRSPTPEVKDAVGADAEPEKEPVAPPVASGQMAELEITEVDSDTSALELRKGEDNKK